MKYIKRLLILPFVVAIAIWALAYQFLNLIRDFMLYGGEFIAYSKSNTTINDVYKKLEEKL